MNAFSNPWLAGIAAGITSGVIVAWISQAVLNRRDRRGATEKTAVANQEILQALRLAVAEGQIPRRETIAALIRATARRHNLSPSSLYQPAEIADELIRDVMESTLLSAARKSELCAQLSYLPVAFPPATSMAAPVEISEAPEPAAAPHGRAETHTVSALTGILAGVLSGVFAGRELLGKYLGAVPHGLRIGVEALAGTAAALLALAVVELIFGDAPDQPEAERVAEEK